MEKEESTVRRTAPPSPGSGSDSGGRGGKGRPRKRLSAARVAVLAVLACFLVAGGAWAAFAASLGQADYLWYVNNQNEDPDTYTISNGQELRALAEIVNGTAVLNEGEEPLQDSFEGKTIVVASTAQTIVLNSSGTSYEFTPIGTEEHPFEGTFDGQVGDGSVQIQGLQITERTDSNTGLFGVVGSSGTIENVSVSGQITIDSDTPLSNVGGLVGNCQGLLENCSSSVKISITNSFAPTEDTPTPLNNIGGVVGCMTGSTDTGASLSNCSFSGSLTIEDEQDALVNASNSAIPVALGIGGVCGMLGSADEATTGVSADGLSNSGDLYLSFTGLGGKDRFGEQVISKPSCVGGCVGYSSGSITNSCNTGEVRGSTWGDDKYGYETTYDNGASQCGGIVGNLRNVIVSNHYTTTQEADNGSKDNQITVQNCYNTGMVIGCNEVGGIAGTTGTYTLITECSNGNYTGNNRETDGQLNSSTQGAVVCTRWNKPCAGGIAGTTMGSITFCYNRAQVNNTQAGYYIAGICGHLGSDKMDTMENLQDDPTYQCEIHSCWNSGQIGLGHATSNKYGALVGSNDGYLHDCVVLEGCVITGEVYDDDDNPTGESETGSDAVGDGSWGDYHNISVLTLSDLQQSSGLAILNAYAQTANGFTNYWFSGAGTAEDGGNYNDGYPVLLSWADVYGATDISTLGLTQLTDQAMASYSPTSEPVPEVSLATADGTVLVQNVDYLIKAQEGATEMTVDDANPTPYKYTVVGIGKYTGELVDFGKYGISAGSLEDMSVQVSSPKFNWEVQFPETVQVYDSTGAEVPSSEYTYVIYDSSTNNLESTSSGKYVAFDSAGYISFDGGVTLEPALEAQSKTSGAEFLVYDREGRLIADSDGGVYDPETGEMVTGSVVNTFKVASGSSYYTIEVTGGAGLMNYKQAVTNTVNNNDGDAGYVVEIQGTGAYEGSSTTGRYVIKPANLVEDCETTVSYDGQTWTLDNESQKLYQLDEEGQKVWGMSVDFTGNPIRPTISVSYLGRTLVEDIAIVTNPDSGSLLYSESCDYRVLYGPISTTTAVEETNYPNRDAVDAEAQDESEVAAVTAKASSGANVSVTDESLGYVKCFESYTVCRFNIEGVDISDERCAVTATDQAEPEEGETIDPVQVKLTTTVVEDGEATQVESTLVEGTDYMVSYRDASGTVLDAAPTALNDDSNPYYVAVVTPLSPNMTGEAVERQFKIVEAETFEVEDIPETTWDVGKLSPTLTFADAETGEELSLELGVDYTYELWLQYASAAYCNSDTQEPLTYVWYNNIVSFDTSGYYSVEVRVSGLGKYAGTSATKTWKISQLDLADTQVEDWEVEASPEMQYGYDRIDSRSPIMAYYKGYLVAGGDSSGRWSSPLVRLDFSEEVHAGDEITITLISEGSCKPFVYKSSITLEGTTAVVQPHDLSDSSFGGYGISIESDTTYTGDAIEPVSLPKIVEGEDYTIQYQNNVDAGTAQYVITGMGDYTGTRRGSFTISPKALEDGSDDYTVEIADQTYTGGQIKPVPTVTDASSGTPVELVLGRDFTVAYGANTEGTGQVYISGMGNYTTGTGKQLVGTFNIVVDDQNVTYWVEYVDADGDAVAYTKEVSGGKAGDVVTEQALDVSGYVLKDASLQEQTITLASGTKNTITFVYAKEGSEEDDAIDLADAVVQGTEDVVYEEGAVYTPITVWYEGMQLTEGVDYTIFYQNNNKVGTATYTITAVEGSSFTGTVSGSFEIVEASAETPDPAEDPVVTPDPTEITKAMFTVDTADALWAGKAVTKAVSGSDDGTALVEGTDYTVAYENNARPGQTTITITGIGDYTGELEYSFFIYYADVPTSLAGDGDAWYYDAVYQLSELGVMSGYDTNWHFGVGDSILRQDVVTMLWRYCCPDEYAAYDASAAANGSGLADVEDGMYYTAAVNWAVEAGIVTGYTEGDDAGKFGVGDTMTFEQLVTVIARMELGGEGAAAAYSTASLYSGAFADAGQVSSWAAGSMAWAVDQGLVTGYIESADSASLAPLSDVERERVATVLARYINFVS